MERMECCVSMKMERMRFVKQLRNHLEFVSSYATVSICASSSEIIANQSSELIHEFELRLLHFYIVVVLSRAGSLRVHSCVLSL
mmetsp:Transcript_13113/g.23589  ORF Transcript_13113/g.23589 Transcript_13113/m.23589 type:complete len:84 (-) Transcript_13113:2483-2734(-)